MVYKVAVYVENFPSLALFLGGEHFSVLMNQVRQLIEELLPDKVVSYIEGGAFFVSGFSSLREAEHHAIHIVMALEGRTFKIHNVPFVLSTVAGVARDSEEVALAVARQCRALGKRVCSFKDIHVDLNFSEKLTKLKLLEDAIKNDRIEPVFQPIVNNRLRYVEKFEVLTRVYTDEGKELSLGNFLDVIHEQDFYTELTLLSFSKALDIIASYEYEFSLNFSMSDIRNRRLIEFITTRIEEEPYIGSRLILELLEVESYEDYKNFKTFSEYMSRFGVHIAIDDFGTGYSNFERILELKPRYIKIDGSIIKRLPSDRVAFSLVRSISAFCRDAGIDTVAEFVADEEIYQIVKGLGITYSQGFYFYKPMSGEEFLKEFG